MFRHRSFSGSIASAALVTPLVCGRKLHNKNFQAKKKILNDVYTIQPCNVTWLTAKVMGGLQILKGTNPTSCYSRLSIGYGAMCYCRIWVSDLRFSNSSVEAYACDDVGGTLVDSGIDQLEVADSQDDLVNIKPLGSGIDGSSMIFSQKDSSNLESRFIQELLIWNPDSFKSCQVPLVGPNIYKSWIRLIMGFLN